MPRPRLHNYLRTARLSAGLSQPELGTLLGVSDDVIGNVERGRCEPTLSLALGCAVLFGRSASELFPSLHDDAERGVGERAAAFDERLRERTDHASLKKIALLSPFTDRLTTFTSPYEEFQAA